MRNSSLCNRAGAALLVICALSLASVAKAAEPIRIGMTMALTGGVAVAGKQVLLALQIWRDDVNAKGGLLGRPIELVYYDDQSNPATVPALYQKLLDVDKVDIIIGGYGTNLLAPALSMPVPEFPFRLRCWAAYTAAQRTTC